MNRADTALAAIRSMRKLLSSSIVRVAGSALGFMATFAVTGALGTADAGILFGTMTWSLIIAIIARWGASDRILIDLPPLYGSWREKAIAAFINREIMFTVFRSAICLVPFSIYWQVCNSFGIVPALSLPLLAILSPLNAVLQLITSFQKAFGLLSTSFFLELIIQPAIVLAYLASASITNKIPTLTSVSVTYSVSVIVSLLISLFVFTPFKWHKSPLKNYILKGKRRSTNFAIIEISNYASVWLPMLLLPFLVSPSAVGTFNLAFRVATAITILSSLIGLVALPRLAIAWRRRDESAWRNAIVEARLMSTSGSVLFLVLAIFVGLPVLNMAGPTYSAAAEPMIILSVFYAAGAALGPSSAILSVIGREAAIRNVSLAFTAGALIAFVTTVRLWGIDAAAFVTGTSFLFLRICLLSLEVKGMRAVRWEGAR